MNVMRYLAAGLVLAVILLTAVPPAVTQEFTVGPGDVLDVSVVGEPEVSGPQAVDPDGNLVLPMVGPVQVSGLTLTQVTTKLTTALQKFIRSPEVVVAIRQAGVRRQFVYLLGQVNHTGAYQMQDGWTVAELIAVAGGTTGRAALTQAMILRKSETIPVNLDQLLNQGDTKADMALAPGDVVIVPETANRIILMGEVPKPGPYAFRPGDRVVDVLSAAGGPTGNASLANIGVIRGAGGNEKASVVPANIDRFYKSGDMSQNVLLQPGDVVYVPPKSAGFNWGSILNSLNGLTYLLLLLK